MGKRARRFNRDNDRNKKSIVAQMPATSEDEAPYDEPYHEYHARSDLQDYSCDDEWWEQRAATRSSEQEASK